MVIRDYLNENKQITLPVKPGTPSEIFSRNAVANPFDRFAAQVLDFFVVFIPAFSLAAAPLKRHLTESFLSGDWQSVITLYGQVILVCLTVFLVSQIVSRLFFRESFGKKVMGLKVVNLWTGEAPSLWDQAVRSIYIFCQILLLGLPFIFVLTNKKHRGVHDQLTDTMVVNVSGKPSPPLHVWPLQLTVRVFAILCFGVMLPMALKVTSSVANFVDIQSALDPSPTTDSATCQKTESLEEAMALVASGYMDTSCLKADVDLEFVDGAAPSALGYLAKSFVYVENPDLSDQYLEKVCKMDSESAACVLARFISSWSDGNMDQVESVLEHAKDYHEPYLSLWALRYYQQAGLYQKSLEFAKGLTRNEQFGIYVRAQVLKSKYFLNNISGSDEDLRKMENDSDSPVVLDTMAWSCLKKISNSCKNTADQFCQTVMKTDKRENYQQPRVLLSQIRLQECQGKNIDPESYVSKGQPKAWKEFIYALDKETRGDMKSAWSLYSGVVKMESAPDYLKSEAIRRMSLHPEISEIKNLGEMVATIETYEHRRESALQVLKVYDKLHLKDVAESLKDEFEADSSDGRKPASVKKKEAR